MRGGPGSRALGLRQQAARVGFMWPTLDARVTGRVLIVKGVVRPTALTGEYRVRIVYELGDVPKAYVDAPVLRPRDDGQRIPHVYPGPRPCLYLPSSGEWSNRMSLATTIIPWLMLWLTYYELWHATGVWQGGGEHGAAADALPSGSPPADVEPKAERAPAPVEQAMSNASEQ